MRYHAPLDPECEMVHAFISLLNDDPIARTMADEIIEIFELRHRQTCERCREFGLANIEVEG